MGSDLSPQHSSLLERPRTLQSTPGLVPPQGTPAAHCCTHRGTWGPEGHGASADTGGRGTGALRRKGSAPFKAPGAAMALHFPDLEQLPAALEEAERSGSTETPRGHPCAPNVLLNQPLYTTAALCQQKHRVPNADPSSHQNPSTKGPQHPRGAKGTHGANPTGTGAVGGLGHPRPIAGTVSPQTPQQHPTRPTST